MRIRFIVFFINFPDSFLTENTMLFDVGGRLSHNCCFVTCFAEDEKAKREVSAWTVDGDINTDPWSGYRYTGKLRPHYPLVNNWNDVSTFKSLQQSKTTVRRFLSDCAILLRSCKIYLHNHLQGNTHPTQFMLVMASAIAESLSNGPQLQDQKHFKRLQINHAERE